MATNIIFLFNSAMLGFGLAMDAFSVSLANGFTHPHIKRRRRHEIAFVYAAFQIMMPIIGWFFVHYAAEMFNGFKPFIPWIALILLAIIGGKMLIEGIREKNVLKIFLAMSAQTPNVPITWEAVNPIYPTKSLSYKE